MLTKQTWINREVKLLLKEHNTAIRSGDTQLDRVARSNKLSKRQRSTGKTFKGHFNEGTPGVPGRESNASQNSRAP